MDNFIRWCFTLALALLGLAAIGLFVSIIASLVLSVAALLAALAGIIAFVWEDF